MKISDYFRKRFVVLAFAPLFLLLLIGAALSGYAQVAGQESAPDVLIRATTGDVLRIIKGESGGKLIGKERRRVVVLVEQKIEQHFDFVAMTRFAVGVNWRKATPEQQELLVTEFRALLLRTYVQVLLSYQDDTIVFKPLRMSPGATDATVRVEIKQAGREAIRIDFAMEKMPEGWKAYDVAVGGVSLVANYRSTFATKIRESGIDGLIRELSEKNRKLRK